MNCYSGNISVGKVESEGREAWQCVVCYNCGAEWNDIFRLIGVDDLNLPRDAPTVQVNLRKPTKAQRKWINTACVLGKGARLIQYCLKLLVAAREVIRNWERGDLAAAVRNLEAVIREVERFLRRIRLRSRFTSNKRMARNPVKF